MKACWRTEWAVVVGAVATLIASPPCARAWSAGEAAAGQPAAGVRAAGEPVRGVILREIDDPATGNRWLLEQPVGHPGGPGRLVLEAGSHAAGAKVDNAARSADQPVLALPVIRAGDAVTLVAHTAVMDAELEAVALAPAAVGAAFRARLKMGSRVVEVVALGAGRAAWAPRSGEMR